MLTPKIIADVERIENQFHERIHSTATRRDHSLQAWAEWEEAVSAWHTQKYPTDKFWTSEFLADLSASKRDAIEDAILYLEVDPWYFHSGYLKERLLKGLRSATLNEHDRKRLRDVIWKIANGKNRREFRQYCLTATKVADEEMILSLKSIPPELDLQAQGKFSYLLRYVQRY